MGSSMGSHVGTRGSPWSAIKIAMGTRGSPQDTTGRHGIPRRTPRCLPWKFPREFPARGFPLEIRRAFRREHTHGIPRLPLRRLSFDTVHLIISNTRYISIDAIAEPYIPRTLESSMGARPRSPMGFHGVPTLTSYWVP